MAKKCTCDKLAAAITLRVDYFTNALSNTISDASCENTHSLSTSLKRLLVVNDAISALYGKELISSKRLAKIKSFRNELAAIRDNHELLIKLESLKLKNKFLAHVINVLNDRQLTLEKDTTKHCQALAKLKIDKRFSGKLKFLKNKFKIKPRKLITSLLEKTADFHQRAIEDADDKALHKMRVRYKAFRYSYELLAPCIIETGEDTLSYLRTIQTALGEAHDWLVMLETIERIEEPENAPGKKRLLNSVAIRLKKSNQYARDYISKEWANLQELCLLAPD